MWLIAGKDVQPVLGQYDLLQWVWVSNLQIYPISEACWCKIWTKCISTENSLAIRKNPPEL